MLKHAAFVRITEEAPELLCCNCQQPLAGEGFSFQANYGDEAKTPLGPVFKAAYVHGHPICARSGCYSAGWDERNGLRRVCGCGIRSAREHAPRTG